MRILFFYTGYRQLAEISHSALFAQRYQHDFKDADVIYHCNNTAIGRDTLESLVGDFANPIKKIITTDKNTGFRLGHIEAIADSYPLIQEGEYDWVIHLHPDVYLTDEARFLGLLHKADTSEQNAIMFPLFEADAMAYTTDLFAWKPTRVKRDVFSDYKNYVNRSDVIPETYLYESLHRQNVPILSVKRYRGRGWQREIDEVGAWHPHEQARVENFLEYGVYFPCGPIKNYVLNIKKLIKKYL